MRMKKAIMISFIIGLFFMFTQVVAAQTKSKKKSGEKGKAKSKKTWGVKGARSSSSLRRLNGEIYGTRRYMLSSTKSNGSNNTVTQPNYDDRKGFGLGLFYNYELHEEVAIELNVLYSQKGTKEKNSESLLKINYIEVPVLLKLRLISLKNFIFALFVGSYAAFELNTEFYVPVPEEGTIPEVPLEFDPNRVKGMDFGLIFGGSLQMGNITLEARYSEGITRVIKDGNAKNSVLTFMVGYGF